MLFQSTPSARRATFKSRNCRSYSGISIHALREEGDQFANLGEQPVKKFQSTPSARRATVCACYSCIVAKISIHALREEGD